jgi:hypothetical protein
MLGALTYHAITAMTHARLEAIDRRLLSKIKSGRNVSALERQVRFLAKTAHESMSLMPHLPDGKSLPRFARNLSTYAVFGSVGPTIPRFAAMLALNQRWLFDTIHGGNPDPNRQRVLARSSDFLLKVAERGTALINASGVADKPAEIGKLRAYILGHSCHVAADLVSSPFVDALTWQLGEGGRARLTEAQVIRAIDLAAARLFSRDQPPDAHGQPYQGWWLKPADLPQGFFDAFKEALDEIYGPGARPKVRPAAGSADVSPQVTQAFWDQFNTPPPPELSVSLLEDGYSAFRSAMEGTYVWRFRDWLAFTALIFVPPIGAYPLIVAMPHARALFSDGAQVDGHPVDTAIGWLGLVTAPLATSALAPLILSIIVAAFTSYGVGSETVFGWVSGGVNFVTAIISLATITSTNTDNPALRWIFLFIIPFLGLVAHSSFVLLRSGSDPRHVLLALSSLIPCAITAFYLLYHVVWNLSQDTGMNAWLKDGWGSVGFLIPWILWAGLMIGAWLLLSHFLATSIGSQPESDEFVTGRKHFLRLFGHSSLLHDPGVAADPTAERLRPSLATHYFPTDRVPLLKIWWEGGGDLWMRSDRNALQFSTSEDGSGDPQTILTPAAAMTAAEFGDFLNKAVKEGANFNQKLKAERFDPIEFDYVLPSGEVFADGGDEETTLAEHNAEAAKFIKLKTTSGDPTVLFHAPRAHLAGFQGTEGPLLVDFDRGAAVDGAGQATFEGRTIVRGDATTRFTMFFQPGDVFATTGVAAGDESRIVASVPHDQVLIVSMPFTAAVAGEHTYRRTANTRDTDTPAGTLQQTTTFRVYQGAGFDAMFLPGDIVRTVPTAPAAPEERTVVQVISATQLMVDKPFGVAAFGTPPSSVPCVRVGRLSREGFRYAPVSPVGAFAGDSLMERAADLGAILCMGAATHMLGATDLQAVTTGREEDQRPAVNTVYQVFRNWNLNHRRINEWQMLIGGGAISEKGGAPASPDPLQSVPSGWTAATPAGEGVANQLGWVPLMERWLDVASRPGVNSLADEAFRAGDPTNRTLSEGIAFLLDLAMPA